MSKVTRQTPMNDVTARAMSKALDDCNKAMARKLDAPADGSVKAKTVETTAKAPKGIDSFQPLFPGTSWERALNRGLKGEHNASKVPAMRLVPRRIDIDEYDRLYLSPRPSHPSVNISPQALPVTNKKVG